MYFVSSLVLSDLTLQTSDQGTRAVAELLWEAQEVRKMGVSLEVEMWSLQDMEEELLEEERLGQKPI